MENKPVRKQMGYKELSLMVDATFKILNASKAPNTPVDNLILESNFINIFMEKLITKVMTEKKTVTRDGKTEETLPSSKQEEFLEATNRLAYLKLYLQEAMALAFQEAIQKLTRMPIEYYCIVKTVSNYPSKETH